MNGEFTESQKKLFEKAIEKWGKKAQVNMAKEECAELVVALSHYERGRIELEELLEEMADVRIMYEQLYLFFDENKSDKIIQDKMERLEERINE